MRNSIMAFMALLLAGCGETTNVTPAPEVDLRAQAFRLIERSESFEEFVRREAADLTFFLDEGVPVELEQLGSEQNGYRHEHRYLVPAPRTSGVVTVYHPDGFTGYQADSVARRHVQNTLDFGYAVRVCGMPVVRDWHEPPPCETVHPSPT